MGDHAARMTFDAIPSAEPLPINGYLSPIP
ncbi:hypothetical protein FEP39_03428 [Burkholderia multivorans]|jgi:hypothetical protein|nr:hypothetical protein NP80_5380 [Burkholderia multivorans ATCC BAA-247]MDR8739164.1 hypothetical protein [Burkholderia pseudomultivorans]MDR8765515.1 hypothetical protein [Burkholderia multivorans]MDR8771027.1 hypothetical protein [Burkholderia multivorans]MDR8792383.1 hypothetical protein [Burkholderia multivorans]